MSELLPCPHCNGRGFPSMPTARRSDKYDSADRLFPIVRCAQCYAESPGKDGDFTMQTAIVAWNTRTTPASPESKATGAPTSEAFAAAVSAFVALRATIDARFESATAARLSVAEWQTLLTYDEVVQQALASHALEVIALKEQLEQSR